jgi:hypothetical protein
MQKMQITITKDDAEENTISSASPINRTILRRRQSRAQHKKKTAPLLMLPSQKHNNANDIKTISIS